MLTRNEMIFKWILYFILGIMAGIQLIYRFDHPEMTETQLYLNFFEAFRYTLR